MNELVEIKQESVMEVFTTPHGLDPYLDKIKAEVDNFTKTVVDINEKKNREKIKSMAFKVTRSKTYLDGLGKDLVTDLKKKPKLIDAERKRARELIEEWAAEVRKPLTDFEEAQRLRVEQITASIDHLRSLVNISPDSSSDHIGYNLDEASEFEIDEMFDEYRETAVNAKHETIVKLKELHAKRLQYEKDQEELALLRQQKAEQEAKEAQKSLEREAKEKADREAKEEIEREKARLEQEAKDREDRSQREAKAAQDKIDEANRQTALAEQRAKDAEEKAKRDAEEAKQREDQRIKDDEARAKAEQDRIEAEKSAEAKREADFQEKKYQVRGSIIRSLDQIFQSSTARECEDCADAMLDGRFDHIQVVL